MSQPTICVATSGHLSTCPRMVKAATAFGEAGYRVRIVSAISMDHFCVADERLVRDRPWIWDPVEWSREHAWTKWLWSGVRHRAAMTACVRLGADRVPASVVRSALTRLERELLDRLIAEPADLYYGGGGAIEVVARAARHHGAAYAVDLEDFHTGERWVGRDLDARLAVIERIERTVLPHAVFLTAGSPAIADAYARKYGLRPVAICNTFPLPPTPPVLPEPGDGLKAYWFSQTIGPGRGLEDAVRAFGLAGVPAELHLRGAALDGYVGGLRALAAAVASRLCIEVHPVAPPDQMVDLCRGYHVGLSVEPALSENNALILSNKVLTYVLAGLAVVISDTPGHRPLIGDLGSDAAVYPPGDVAALAAGLRRWHDEPSTLHAAMRRSWEAACRRWHWEHEADRGALLALTRAALAV